MDRIAALVRLSATRYLGRWRVALRYRPGIVLLGGAAIAWAAIRYWCFLKVFDESLAADHAKFPAGVALAVLGCLAAFPVLATMRPARENPRWRLLPTNRIERILTKAFQYVFQFGFILLAGAALATAWVCRSQVNPWLWLLWLVLATSFWASFVHRVYRKLSPAGGVLVASACGVLYGLVASSPAVSRSMASLTSHLGGWQARFWTLAAATFVVTLAALGGGALCGSIPFLRARSGLRPRNRRVRHWLAAWLKHQWYGWSGCLYPYIAVLISLPFLYYLCFDPRPSLVAAFGAGSFIALIVGAPFANVFGRESCAGLDRFAVMPVSGRQILDLENSGFLVAIASFLLLTALLIGLRFGAPAGSGSGFVSAAILLGLLALGGFGSVLWPRRIHPYRGGGAGSLSLAFSLLLMWLLPSVLGVLYAEQKAGLAPLILLAAFYAVLYWLCRPRTGRLLEAKLWGIRARLWGEDF